MQIPVTDTATLVELWRNVAPLAFMACCGFAWRASARLVKVETLLKVAIGENGTNGEMGKLRERSHELANDVQAVLSRTAVLEAKMEDR